MAQHRAAARARRANPVYLAPSQDLDGSAIIDRPPPSPSANPRSAGPPSSTRRGTQLPSPPPVSLVLRRMAGGVILMLVVGLTTCSGLWSAAGAHEAKDAQEQPHHA